MNKGITIKSKWCSLTMLLSLMLVFSISNVSAQKHRCGAIEADALLRTQNPEMGTYEDMVKRISKDADKIAKNGSPKAIVTLPIVFHVIHNGEPVGTGINLAQAQMEAQISQLNLDFSTGENSREGTAWVDTEVRFCGAKQTENGGAFAEEAINRIDRTAKGWIAGPYTVDYIQNTIKPNTQWDPTKYLNVWILDLGDNLLGYAQFPDNVEGGGAANTDGVVLASASIGSLIMPNPLTSGADVDEFGNGRIAAHEVGHFLGLLHIWGDDENEADVCSGTDEVADTPNQGIPSEGNICDMPLPMSCGSTDMIDNYMDYTAGICLRLFTAGQKVRIQASLLQPRRIELTTSSACMAPDPAIPSMGQWGLFILALMMSSMAIVFIGFKRDAKELV